MEVPWLWRFRGPSWTAEAWPSGFVVAVATTALRNPGHKLYDRFPSIGRFWLFLNVSGFDGYQQRTSSVICVWLSSLSGKAEWTEEEDEIIIKAHIELRNKWVEIAKMMNERTTNFIKNYWNGIKRRELSSLIETSNIADNESHVCTNANMQTRNVMTGPSIQFAKSAEFFASDGLVPNYVSSNISNLYFTNTMMFPENYSLMSISDEILDTSVVDDTKFGDGNAIG
ncbi:transcription factor MYB64-like [Telopea speciosissima]|uniref:transcription factor MYB64-like n=1 Tax=Telopea speciosissima TaxID=54955 RepID=UPI001CC78608|nr:transcription factor MYB64-like [Telopea speciosissima]